MTLHDTVRRAGSKENVTLICPQCAKVFTDEPNFCAACGFDFRGKIDSSDTASLKHETIDGRYRIIEKLGEGGMGSVFKVEHVRMGKIAALKLLHPDAAVDRGLKARFLQEARVVAKLSHVNTVQVFDTGELADGSLFITMEYVPGKDLAWHLKAHGAMGEARVVQLGIQILNSLQEAHELGVVHRDIKPANVMVVRKKDGDERVKLLDFGIAKLQESDGRKSVTGEFVGTPAYMSPEQVRGDEVDARSDLYSLGSMLFELVSGVPLFDGINAIDIARKHLDTPTRKFSEACPEKSISPGFEHIVQKALSKELTERFQNADQMRKALVDLRKSLGVVAHEFTPVPDQLSARMLSREDFDKFENRMRRWRVLTPLLWVALLVGGIGLASVFFQRHKVDAALPQRAEVEPNDSTAQATRFENEVRGSIGASSDATGDKDLFVTQVEAGHYRVSLSGIDDLNLAVEVLQIQTEAQKEKVTRVALIDDFGIGAPEKIEGLVLAAGTVYFRVQEYAFCNEPTRKSRERALTQYTLGISKMTGGHLESEPNDTESTAVVLAPGEPINAFSGGAVDSSENFIALRPTAPFTWIDWFKVSADALVCVIPSVGQTLRIVDAKALHEWELKQKEYKIGKPPPLVPESLSAQLPFCFEPSVAVNSESELMGRFKITSKESGPYVVFAALPTRIDALVATLNTIDNAQTRSQLSSAVKDKWKTKANTSALDAFLVAP
jgi:eukaryotic-like serine/threonine-protein kinase